MYFANIGFTPIQVEEMNTRFKTALLDYASETPDNVASIEKIEVGKVKIDKTMHSGLKVKGKNILLSEIMYEIEAMPMPPEIKEQFSKLTEEEWKAATRIMYLVLSSLEDEK